MSNIESIDPPFFDKLDFLPLLYRFFRSQLANQTKINKGSSSFTPTPSHEARAIDIVLKDYIFPSVQLVYETGATSATTDIGAMLLTPKVLYLLLKFSFLYKQELFF